jgi:hypothetical protein
MNKLQFQVLYREFLFRIVDLEILAPQGDLGKLLGQFAGLLVFVSLWLSFVAGIMSAQKNPLVGLLVVWIAQHFLIATTMLAVGLFAVMSWDSTFPDRRDVLVLLPLPLPARALLLAKVTSVATGLSLTVLSLNAFTGILAPAAAASGIFSLIRSFAAYWTAMFAAGVFIFCCVLSVQGVAQLLPRQIFLRVSSFLQMAFFILLLTVYFLQPPFSDFGALLTNQRLLFRVPSYWFFGLWQQLSGATFPGAALLAQRAWTGLGFAILGAALAYLLCYFRTLRKIAEQPDILPGGRGLRWLPRFGNSFETAVGQFSVRTLLRSRQHRVVLSFYLGIALGLAMFVAKGPVLKEDLAKQNAWYQVNAPLLVASAVILCFAVVGTRVVFSMPLELRANWIFRVTGRSSVDACLAASRRSLYALALAPVWLVSGVLCFRVWPGHTAAEHMALLGLLGILAGELSLRDFHKIPFACSYLPGKSRFNMAIVYLALFLMAVSWAAELEMRAFTDANLYALTLLTLAVAAAMARWQTTAQAKSEYAELRFDEVPEPAVLALDLHRDGVTPLP